MSWLDMTSGWTCPTLVFLFFILINTSAIKKNELPKKKKPTVCLETWHYHRLQRNEKKRVASSENFFMFFWFQQMCGHVKMDPPGHSSGSLILFGSLVGFRRNLSENTDQFLQPQPNHHLVSWISGQGIKDSQESWRCRLKQKPERYFL